jgi:holliday junction DNA helicase RuvA
LRLGAERAAAVIASLRGTLLEKSLEGAVLEAGGVGYAVTLTVSALRSLPPLGAEARLFVHTHAVQDGGLQLYGFADPDERRVFETLLSVQGVGPRVAVAILSGMPLPDLVRAISGSDLARLTQIRGVGRKIAERLSLELRDKIGLAVTGDSPAPAPAPAVPSGRLGEVHAALMSLGYKPAEIEPVLPGLDAAHAPADLVKQALAALRKK